MTGDLTLPARGAAGVSIAWVSEDPKIINFETPGTGVVTRPDMMDTEVALTATLTKNAATDTKVFALIVIMSEDADNMQMYPYTCSNGTKAPGMTTAQNTEKCQSCDMGYVLRDEACEQTYPYRCTGGTAAQGTTTTQNTQKCVSCRAGYSLQPSNMTCVCTAYLTYLCLTNQ